MLHIISTTCGYDQLFERIAPEDILLFIGSAVLSLHKKSVAAEKILAHCIDSQCYVLEADLFARGLRESDILSKIKRVDYPGFVSLTVEHKHIKSWN